MSKAIGERMKEYEVAMESNLDPKLPYLMRLDGHCFSKFTKQFKKPYDTRIHEAMVRTTADLIQEFTCVSGFTASDEITLVFPAPATEEEIAQGKSTVIPFNGRVMKTATLAAGYCSARFNFHLQAQPIYDTDSPLLISKIKDAHAYFDARIFSVRSKEETMNNIMWRSRYDTERNSVSMLAQANFSHKVLEGLSKKDQKAKLLNDKQINWDEEPNWFKYGDTLKKELFDKECENPKTGEKTIAKRAKIVAKAFRYENFRQEFIDLLYAKYWNDVDLSFLPDITSAVVEY